jgi:glycosyltransferase involved in cell wall biosynthesis
MNRKFKHKFVQEVGYKSDVNGSLSLDLPNNISEEDLPNISILTITKNRRKLFPIALYNWNNFVYPKDKLEWIIIDDGEEDLSDLLGDDTRIKYIREGKSNWNIGDKRNFAVEKAQYDYLLNMDDDDYHFPDSVLAKARIMLRYPTKGCLYCHNLGSCNINDKTSAILENYKDIPEATMFFTRKFWERRKFGETLPGVSESYNMCKKRETEMMKLSFWFSCIALSHSSNYTQNLRSFENLKKDNCPSFYDIVFDSKLKIILNSIINDNKKK